MLSLAVCYVKRYKMEVQLGDLPAALFPPGFRALPWSADLLDAHADVLARCFAGEVDASVFPSLASHDGCHSLMTEVARRRSFIPEATWLLVDPDGTPCGSVQALRERTGLGAIQNVGILPGWRGRRLAEALLLYALNGMHAAGLGRAVLEVTAANEPAVRLYRRLGFRRAKVVYKAVSS